MKRISPLIFVLSILLAACTAPTPSAPAPVETEPPAAYPPSESAENAPAAVPTTAYPAPESTQPAAAVEPTAAYPAPQSTPPSLSGPTTTYTNPEAGFALDYPAGWTINDVSEEIRKSGSIYTVTLVSFTAEGDKQQEGIPPDQAKLDINVFGKAASLEEAGQAMRGMVEGGDPPGQILSEAEITLPGGIQALRWEVESRGDTAVLYITAISGNNVVLSGIGDPTQFEPVMQTLRPAS